LPLLRHERTPLTLDRVRVSIHQELIDGTPHFVPLAFVRDVNSFNQSKQYHRLLNEKSPVPLRMLAREWMERNQT
jgi:hypothetical protein